ncbi:solute carrier family 22 member 5-like isoform X2 [Stegodyphus dumicola]|uniref:solute carrier family 22 member 5-like isoform X2 n=1 Tax=Stegodyphus dumicola TaxID=202533 RepID=UPI0015ABB5E0|nr:solute carrier family 22 member 5-like isoform X2 [Stegodyphus dumicola]
MTMVSIAQSHLDRVLLMVDTPGRYHFLIAFLLCCMQFPVSFSGHLLTFYTATPKHRCRAESNLTFGDYDLRPIITVNGRRQYSACELYSDPRDHSKGTKACDDGWEFQVRNGESTVVTEWELVCEYEALAALLPYLATVAAMIGALATGILADKYGRKYVLVLSLLFHTSFGVFLHFLPLFGIFATVFSLQAFLIAGVQCTSYLLLIENLPTTWHSKAALAVAIFHCLGELILATLAWLIRHWRYLQLIISAPGVVVFGYFWFVVSLVSKCTAEEIPALRDNPYSRLFVHGVLELSFVILIHLASTSVGLKLTQATSLSISGICCMFAAIVNHQIVQMRFRFVTERGLHHFAPVFALLGKSIANASFLTLYMYAIKTFPTGVRGLGLSSCMFWGEVAHLFVPHFDTLHSHSRFQILAIAGALSFVAGILTSWLLPDCTDRPLATIAEEVEIGQTKIINDSDLDFRDTSIASGFVPNIPAEDPETSVRSNNSVNEFEKLNFGKGFLRRLAFLIRCKTQRLFSPSKYSTAQMSYGKEIPPISVVGGDIFEPVTGFIFKWDQAEPTVKISDFEKEMSVYWKPNCDPNEKKLNDKHLNSLNILYNIQSNALDGSNECVELQNSSEDITDSSL